ncbi:MAG: gamma carbonic anhydrase family protein [Marinilabiliales bacterium]|nr:gamma carbonic anhydrase family protein [Marinilabiliales bacterium]
MAIIKSLRGKSPVIGQNCYLAETSVVIGDLRIGDNCSIWFGAVLRGDVNSIEIGNNVNIQDNAVIHGTFEKSATHIGNNVSIAHGAIVHGCTIHDNVLIGMNAVVLDDAEIHSNSIVAAGAIVTKGTVIESGSVYAGSPAKKIKELSKELLEGEILRIANNYHTYSSWYQADAEEQ